MAASPTAYKDFDVDCAVISICGTTSGRIATQNKNLACFVCYLKIFITFFLMKNFLSILKQIILEKLKNNKDFSRPSGL